MRAAILLAAVVGLTMLPSPAPACRTSMQMTPFLFDALPAIPSDYIAARVEILPYDRRDLLVIRTRIVTMIQGEYAGSNLRLDVHVMSSCDRFPQPGETGIVVGRLVESAPRALVIEPMRAPSPLHGGAYPNAVVPVPR